MQPALSGCYPHCHSSPPILRSVSALRKKQCNNGLSELSLGRVLMYWRSYGWVFKSINFKARNIRHHLLFISVRIKTITPWGLGWRARIPKTPVSEYKRPMEGIVREYSGGISYIMRPIANRNLQR